jgi:hypothetical protein
MSRSDGNLEVTPDLHLRAHGRSRVQRWSACRAGAAADESGPAIRGSELGKSADCHDRTAGWRCVNTQTEPPIAMMTMAITAATSRTEADCAQASPQRRTLDAASVSSSCDHANSDAAIVGAKSGRPAVSSSSPPGYDTAGGEALTGLRLMSLQGWPDPSLARHFTVGTTIQRALGVGHAARRGCVGVQVAAL